LSSEGIARTLSITLKIIDQVMQVKMRKIVEISAPKIGMMLMIKITANGRKPRIGTDCKTSKTGKRVLNHLGLWTMNKPKETEKIIESA
jgi:hypothetical protein